MLGQKRTVCANCKKTFQSGDRYCRYCGAPMGRPDYIDETFADIYGPPPVNRTHICERCGFQWETYKMIDDERWCPRCGGAAPAAGDDDFSEWA